MNPINEFSFVYDGLYARFALVLCICMRLLPSSLLLLLLRVYVADVGGGGGAVFDFVFSFFPFGNYAPIAGGMGSRTDTRNAGLI